MEQQQCRDYYPEGFEKRLAAYKVYSAEICAYYGQRVHGIHDNHNPQETLWQVQLIPASLCRLVGKTTKHPL